MNKPFFSLIFLILFAAPTFCFAVTYYVATTGNNSNPGTLVSPFKTITYGVGKLVEGDILYVRAGTYKEMVTISRNGTSASPITITGYYNGSTYEVPVIDGGGTLPPWDWGYLMKIEGSYVNVSYFEIKGSRKGIGLILLTPGKNIKVSFIKSHDNGENGIIVRADNCTVEDCEIYQNCQTNVAHAINGSWASGLSFAREPKNGITDNGIMRRCKVYDNHGEGISAFEASHITIEDCVTYDNWAPNLYISDATYCKVQRNLIYNSTNPAFTARYPLVGLCVFDELSGRISPTTGFNVPYTSNNTIINNFFYRASISLYIWSEALVPNPGLKNSLIANNTIADAPLLIGGTGERAVHVNSQIRNNIFYGSANTILAKGGLTFSNNFWKIIPSANAAGTSDVFGDPKIARTGATTRGAITGDYFKLLATSTAINKAMVLTQVTEDFFKTVRDSLPDIGGQEFDGTVGLFDMHTKNTNIFRLFPNPATINLTLELPVIQNNNKIQIFNTLGKLVKEVNVSAMKKQVSIEDLLNGAYFIRLTTLPNASMKFIKQ